MRGSGLSWNGEQKSKGTEVTSKVWRGTPSHDPYFLFILEKSPNSLNFLRHSPSPALKAGSKRGGTETSVVDNNTTPEANRALVISSMLYALFELEVVGDWKVEGVEKWKCEDSVEKFEGVWIGGC